MVLDHQTLFMLMALQQKLVWIVYVVVASFPGSPRFCCIILENRAEGERF